MRFRTIASAELARLRLLACSRARLWDYKVVVVEKRVLLLAYLVGLCGPTSVDELLAERLSLPRSPSSLFSLSITTPTTSSRALGANKRARELGQRASPFLRRLGEK